MTLALNHPRADIQMVTEIIHEDGKVQERNVTSTKLQTEQNGMNEERKEGNFHIHVC